MKYCNTCNNYVDDNYVNCPHCGETYLYIVNPDGTLSHPPAANVNYAQSGAYDSQQYPQYEQQTPAMPEKAKKNNNKLILIIVAVAVVLLVAILAFPSSSSDNEETTINETTEATVVEEITEEETTEEETTEAQLSIKSNFYKGYINGSYYVNAFANLSFDITNIPESTDSVYSSFENDRTVCGYASVDDISGQSFVFVIEDISSNFITYDKETYLGQVVKSINDGLAAQNVIAEMSESFSYDVAGNDYLSIKLSVANGFTEYVCVDIVDAKAIVFIVGALSEDTVKSLLDSVKSGTDVEIVTEIEENSDIVESTNETEETEAANEVITIEETTVA